MWMGQNLSLTNLPFDTGGRSILVLSSTDQQTSTSKLLPTCHNLRQTPISTDHPTGKKSRRQPSNPRLGKNPGADAIPAEVYKHGGDTLLQRMTDPFCRMSDEEVIPQQLKDASTIRLYKKAIRQLCDNYRRGESLSWP